MKLREAAQQALEALELAGMSHDVMLMSDPPQDAWKARSVSWKLAQAMTALRAALAEDAMQRLTDVQQKMERKPLTDEEIDKVWRSVDYKISYDNFRLAIARAIERAHEIGDEK